MHNTHKFFIARPPRPSCAFETGVFPPEKAAVPPGPMLGQLRASLPRVRHVGCYATARNVLAKPLAELQALREAGLSIVYMGPGPAPRGGGGHCTKCPVGVGNGAKLCPLFILFSGVRNRSSAVSSDPDWLPATKRL